MTSFRKGTLIVGLVSLAAMSFAQPDPVRVQEFAQAVAKAEGFGIKGTVPTRYHNPGDFRILKGHSMPGQVGRNQHGYVIFKNDAAGWAALENQINLVLQGRSKAYTADMPITKIAKRYATGWQLWSKNVAKNLHVSPNTTLRAFVNTPIQAPELSFVDDSKALADILSIQPELPELAIPDTVLDELFSDGDVPMHLDPKVQKDFEQELQHHIFEQDQENPQRQSVLI